MWPGDFRLADEASGCWGFCTSVVMGVAAEAHGGQGSPVAGGGAVVGLRHNLVTPWLISRFRSSCGAYQRVMLGPLYNHIGGIMRKLAVLAGAVALAAMVGACSSSGGSASSSTSAKATATPMSGTETFTGSVTGAAAAKLLNSNSNTGPSFSSLVFTGPVTTTIRGPVGLGNDGNAKTATHTFVTPAGNFTVQHTTKTNGQAQPTVTGKSGSTCYFSQNIGTGGYTVLGSKSTGKFAGATGSGTYAITILAEANLLAGKTTCSANNTGNVMATGASITFKGSGPLTLKQ
jgi:hypothetical protein